jgi:acyl-CoA synthetase (NDP forming)/GNAT superfamily N-acetyltransferase
VDVGVLASDDSLDPADVLLADGSIAVIRSLRSGDRDGLESLHSEASDNSIRWRFFAANRKAGHDYVSHLYSDHGPAECLVATVDSRIVAVATAERGATDDVGTAEVAFLVADPWHGHGLGSLLLEHLAARGRDHGIRRFTAEVLSDNHGMLGVFSDAGFTLTHSSSGGVTDVSMDTVASPLALAAADRRERHAEARSLAPLTTPQRVAVVGARSSGTGVGHAVLSSICAGDFAGEVVAVHPHAESIAGVVAYPRLVDVPGHIDVAVVAVRADQVLAVARDAAQAGVSALVVVTSGFGELGEEGAQIQRTLVEVARAHNMRLVGPNCLGVMINDPDIRLNATFTRLVPPAGGLAVASQSGGVGIAVLDIATRLGLGIGSFLSLGNKADVSGNDLLAAWLDDPRVTAAALYLESFGNAPKFARVARAFAERKPLLAVVGGRSAGGVRAGTSHTAAAATPAAGVDALFAQAGVIACRSAEDLAETALLLSEQPLPAGKRIGIVSNAGGLGVLAADALDAEALDVPEFSLELRGRLAQHVSGTSGTSNPVDLGAGTSGEDLAAAVDLVLLSGEVDAVLVVTVATSVGDPQDLLSALVEPRATLAGIPLVLVSMGGLDAAPSAHEGITVLGSVTAAVGALSRATKYADWLRQPHDEVAPVDEDRAAAARLDARRILDGSHSGGWLTPAEGAGLLSAYGLAPSGDLALNAEDAAQAAARLGFPVAVKVADPEIVHKTDRGLVRVGLSSEEGVLGAVRGFESELGRAPVPVLVQPIAIGVEMALGIVRDPAFGPLVMVAAGGVATGVWDDRAFLVPPVSPGDAARVLRSLRIWPLLDGFRGSEKADVAGLEALLVAAGELSLDVPDLVELDLNPVIVTPHATVLVDVKTRLARFPATDAGIPRRLRSAR